jgi:hypothetical protein
MKYLVASANGYGNVGDDICGYGAKYLIEKLDPQAEVVVTSPPFDEKLAEQADVIVLGGGGIFYDGDRANVENYLSYLEYAQKHGKRSVVLGVGVQGIGTDWGKQRYREVLNRCDLVTVRSPHDKELLDGIGVENVYATQDLGFLANEWVKPIPFKLLRRLVGRITRRKPQLGLAVIDLHVIKGDAFDDTSANFMDSLENSLDHICDKFDVKLLVHSRDDKTWYDKLSSHPGVTIIPYQTIEDFPKFWSAYNNLDLVVGVRFHSIILGLLSKRPVVGVSSVGTKQDRLSRYQMPTLRKQLFHFRDKEAVKDLFEHLPEKFDARVFQPATKQEIAQTKELVHQNGELLAKIIGK